MKTYVVVKAYPGAKLGAELELEPGEAEAHVSEGYLLEKDDESASEIDSSLERMVKTHASHSAEVFKKEYTRQIRGTAPFALTVPEKSAAEAREEKSFGEFVQLLGWAASPFDRPHEYRVARDKLVNKYHSRPNENFGREWAATVQKGAGGFQDSLESKASVQVEAVGALGGFTVPVEYSRELFQLAADRSIFMSRVRRFTMTSNQLNIPALDFSKGATGVSPYLGGMSAVWTGENVGFTQQNASMTQIELKANLLAGYTQASRTLLADSMVALQQVLTGLFANTIAFNVDLAIFTGDGVNKPKGMINSPAVKTFARGTWSSNGVLLTDLAKADSYILPEEEDNAIWITPPSFKQNLYPMADASGKVVFLPNGAPGPEGAVQRRPVLAVFGKPLFFTQLAASAASSGSVNLVIPQAYALGMREEIEIGVSEHYAFTTNLLTYRFLARCDGQSLVNSTLTLQNEDVVAPFVSITT